MIIRNELASDWEGVHQLNVEAFETNAEAFETNAEANLVDALRRQASPIVSLVAEIEGTVVGHILFTPVTLSGLPELNLFGLAPMAVAPAYQKSGIGAALIKQGIEVCEGLNVGAVVVLGHPTYYPKFDFKTSTVFDITCEYEVPEEAFMVNELIPNYLKDKAGVIKYHPAFNQL